MRRAFGVGTAIAAVLAAWALIGCKREAAPPPEPHASLARTATESPSGTASPSGETATPPETALPSEETGSPPAFLVLGDTTLPQPTEENPLVHQDRYDTLAMSLDSTEPVISEGSEVYPADTGSRSGPAPENILATGSFHGNEVPEGIDRQEWLGAFIDSGTCRLQATRIRVRLVRDDISDGEEDTTGKEVTTEVEGKPDFLARDIAALEAGSCEALNSADLGLWPGRRIAFRYRDVEYVLAATFYRSPRFRSKDWGKVPVYRLILTRKAPDGDISEGIYRQTHGNGLLLRRLGDFDRDGLPDLLLDDSGQHNAAATSLYLSRPAAPGRMLKRVGSFVITGC